MLNNESAPNEFDVHALLRTFSWLRFGVVFPVAIWLSLSRSLFSAESITGWIRLAIVAIWAVYFSAPWLQRWLKKAYLPIGMVGMTAASLIVEIVVRFISLSESRAFIAFDSQPRIYLVLFIVVLCIAWLYHVRIVLVFVISVVLINMFLYWFFLEITPTNTPIIFLQLIQISIISVIIFGLIGYVVSGLSQSVQTRRVELAAANRKLAQYASSLEELTISRERNRMARELHDTLAHTLSGLSVQLETARTFWDVDEATAKGLLDESLAATRSGLQETRRALQSLRASPLEDLGLVLALRGLADSAESRTYLKLNLTLPTQPLELPADIEQGIYRVAQEAVNNVVKHATAQTLTLSLKVDEQIELIVTDDGVGFSTSSAQNSDGHYGLVGIQERAALINGQLTITSQPQKGTTIKLTVNRG